MILPGVYIGDNSVKDAGVIVTKNIPSGNVAIGNPARIIMSIEEFIAKHHKQYAKYFEYYYYV